MGLNEFQLGMKALIKKKAVGRTMSRALDAEDLELWQKKENNWAKANAWAKSNAWTKSNDWTNILI